ncbi:MAG: hypothetical protein ABSB29_04405 [Nitrososphaerales archaeon]
MPNCWNRVSGAEKTGYRGCENTLKEKTLYEEIWECRFPKRKTLEEELLTLQALAPDMIEDLHSLFKEAVTDSLANILGQKEARALMRRMARIDFENPHMVFEALDSIHRDGSQILKDAVVEEFRANVHLLLEKVKWGSFTGSEQNRSQRASSDS